MSISLWVKFLRTGLGAWVWEGKASGPAGVLTRLDERILWEHPEVSLPCLKAKGCAWSKACGSTQSLGVVEKALGPCPVQPPGK